MAESSGTSGGDGIQFNRSKLSDMIHPGLLTAPDRPAQNTLRQSHQWLTKRISYLPPFSLVFAASPPRNTNVLLKTVDF
jgi:hypothetical protein